MLTKKVLIVVVPLMLLIIVVYFGFGLNISGKTYDCELMKPLPAGEDARHRTLDFSFKTRLGTNKFGFRKKLVVKKDSVLVQQVSGPPKSNAYYGVFRDKELKEPIEIVDFKWLYRDGPFEEGLTDEVPYDEKKDGIVILKAGTYYAAVYTSSPFGDFEATYLSDICPLNEKCKLAEGKKEPFYVVKDDQKNTFEIVADRQGIIKITTNIRTQGTMKIYDESRKILYQRSAKVNSDKPITIRFDAEDRRRYYAEVSGIEADKETELMYLYSIKYDILYTL